MRDENGRRVTQMGASIVSEATGGRQTRGAPSGKPEAARGNRGPKTAVVHPKVAAAAPSGGQAKKHSPQEKHHHPQVKHRDKEQTRTSSKGKMTDRLAYYRSKYGENFKASTTDQPSEVTKKTGILSKIMGFFFGKKKKGE